VPEGLLDGGAFFRRARREAGPLGGVPVVQGDAALLFAVGDPGNLDGESMLPEHPTPDLLVAGGARAEASRATSARNHCPAASAATRSRTEAHSGVEYSGCAWSM